jgi:hypothetical protein
MGRLVASFNPFDPGDPTYQMQEDDLRNQAYNLPEDTKMAGSNFYPSNENEADESGEIGGDIIANASNRPTSGSEM